MLFSCEAFPMYYYGLGSSLAIISMEVSVQLKWARKRDPSSSTIAITTRTSFLPFSVQTCLIFPTSLVADPQAVNRSYVVFYFSLYSWSFNPTFPVCNLSFNLACHICGHLSQAICLYRRLPISSQTSAKPCVALS